MAAPYRLILKAKLSVCKNEQCEERTKEVYRREKLTPEQHQKAIEIVRDSFDGIVDQVEKVSHLRSDLFAIDFRASKDPLDRSTTKLIRDNYGNLAADTWMEGDIQIYLSKAGGTRTAELELEFISLKRLTTPRKTKSPNQKSPKRRKSPSRRKSPKSRK